ASAVATVSATAASATPLRWVIAEALGAAQEGSTAPVLVKAAVAAHPAWAALVGEVGGGEAAASAVGGGAGRGAAGGVAAVGAVVAAVEAAEDEGMKERRTNMNSMNSNQKYESRPEACVPRALLSALGTLTILCGLVLSLTSTANAQLAARGKAFATAKQA